MATRHAPSSSNSDLPSDLHPVDEPQLSTGRSALRTSFQACCCLNRCLHHGLGCHVQWNAAAGSWTGPQCLLHVNCLELLTVRLALHRFHALLKDQHVLVRSDNTTTVAYINRQGDVRYTVSASSWRMETPSPVGSADLGTVRTSLANSSEEGPPSPSSRSVEPTRMAPGWDEASLSTLPPPVVATITSARASSTRHAYALKWNLFATWCSSCREDPRKCPISVVLSFLQDGLERRLSPSTLKVYVAAIAAHHDAVEDLAVVLSALQRAPFEPWQSVELKFLSMKTALLVALASIKRVGDLQAFSVDEACLEFGPAYSHVILRPRPGYTPKVSTTPFRDQVVNLQVLPSEEADPALTLLCPVRALHAYLDRAQCFRTSDQLFVCYCGKPKGKALSKQRLSHWIVYPIALAYQQQGLPCLLGVKAHSTWSVASSWALAHGDSLIDICRAAGWATANTFARFYNLRVEPISSQPITRIYSGVFACSPFHSSDWICAIFSSGEFLQKP
ncbi:hypothetical protein PO909_030425 [Leuciscus waleckii]